ncbi:MAG: hypothetical protein SFV54_13670 [Bryobacteraceae bacterium]|nr:hypothetical protein [Bryobacteraceae bacterium]
MIIDTSRLAGARAYLRTATGLFDLVQAPLAGGTHSGEFPVKGEGVLVEIDSLDLYLQSGKLVDLFRRQDRRILSLEVQKEMFPGLFADPYRHRVHAIGGMEDFLRGQCFNLRPLDVDGVPVLVSTGTADSTWTSAVYHFGEPVKLTAASWDLATSRLTPEQGFRYEMKLHLWNPGSPVTGPHDAELALAADQTPAAPRLLEFAPRTAVAYRVVFKATVRHDAFLRERLTISSGDPSVGRPLLRSVNVLESVNPAHDFHSLQELTSMADEYKLLDNPDGPPTRLSVSLPLAASLTDGERIRLTVTGGLWDVVEARLNGRVSIRPPMIDKPL